MYGKATMTPVTGRGISGAVERSQVCRGRKGLCELKCDLKRVASGKSQRIWRGGMPRFRERDKFTSKFLSPTQYKKLMIKFNATNRISKPLQDDGIWQNTSNAIITLPPVIQGMPENNLNKKPYQNPEEP